MRFLARAILFIGFSVACASPALAGKRVALIVANAGYKAASLLSRTFEADLVEASPKDAGLTVEVVKDDAVAPRGYRMAAGAGDPKGMFELGVTYESGRATPKDPFQAANWRRKGADLGEAAVKRLTGAGARAN
jgi:TPR repeat protein